MKSNQSQSRLLRMTAALSIACFMLAGLAGCATGSKLVDHDFNFNGWYDTPRWVDQVDLLAYSYGDQYHMVRDDIEKTKRLFPGSTSVPAGTSVGGPMPVGEFLNVKWRIKATGEVVEDKVDLRGRLAKDMTRHGLTFVIDGKQLYVYLITPEPLPKGSPVLKTTLSKYNVTYEIYPTNTYTQKAGSK